MNMIAGIKKVVPDSSGTTLYFFQFKANLLILASAPFSALKFLAKFLMKSNVFSLGEKSGSLRKQERISVSHLSKSGVKIIFIGYLFVGAVIGLCHYNAATTDIFCSFGIFF